jgi:hypothetical protein
VVAQHGVGLEVARVEGRGAGADQAHPVFEERLLECDSRFDEAGQRRGAEELVQVGQRQEPGQGRSLTSDV